MNLLSSLLEKLAELNFWLETRLSVTEFGLESLALLFLGGLFASFLPCVYPLYPITVKILHNRSSRGYTHPLFYYLGIILTYTGFGFLASLLGRGFNEIMRLPETNLFFSLSIFFLGLVSINLVHVSFFKNREFGQKKSIFGTFAMGVGAGLLSSPCVSPVVVTILINLAASTKANNSEILVAAIKMTFFGLGIGFPFLWFGVLGGKLPRSGHWMRLFQGLLAILIFYFAWIYFEKAMSGFKLSGSSVLKFFIFFSVLIWCTLFWLDTPEKRNDPLRKSDRIAATFFLAILILSTKSWVRSNKLDNFQPELSTIQEANLTWYRDRRLAYNEAKQKNLPVFVDFYADWCTNCKEFEKLTKAPGEFNKILQQVILLKIMDFDPAFNDYAKLYKELNIGLPFFLITDSNENLLYKTTDYLQTKTMISVLKEALNLK